MSSYIVELERLRAKLQDTLEDKGFVFIGEADLTTLVNKVDGIGTYNQIKSLLTNDAYVINDTEGLITAVTNNKLAGSKVTNLTLPECVSITVNYAFLNSTSLETVSLPKIISLADYCFQGCSAITSVNIPSVTTINRGAFYGCSSLRRIDLPSSITTAFTDEQFRGCSILNEIIIHKSDSVLPMSNKNSLSSTPFRNGEGGIIYIDTDDDTLITSYQNATNWKDLESTTFKKLSELE